MNVELKLLEKTFTTEDGKNLPYYTLSYDLVDGSTLEVPIKGDKAKLLLLSLKVSQQSK